MPTSKNTAEGLICLTGGDEGPLAAALARGGFDEAWREVERLVNLFGPQNVYVELQRHFDRTEEHRNQAAVRIARALKLPLVATNGVNYATAYEREVMDVLTSIRHHSTLDTAGRLLSLNAERHLRSPREMQELFRDLPEAVTNTTELSARLTYTDERSGIPLPQLSRARWRHHASVSGEARRKKACANGICRSAIRNSSRKPSSKLAANWR